MTLKYCELDCRRNGICEQEDKCGHPKIFEEPLESIVKRLSKMGMEEMIRVVEICLNGDCYVSDEIEDSLLSIADCQDGDEYTVKIYQMSRKEFDALEEFTGF